MNRRTFLTHTGCLAATATLPRLNAAAEAASTGALAAHCIAAVEYRAIDTSWPRPVGKNAKLDVHGQTRSATVVRLRTNQGAAGWGLMPGGRRAAEAATPLITGQSVAELFDPAAGIKTANLRPFDFALHDLAGVILGQPVWRLLGAVRPQSVPVYSGMIYFDDLEPKEAPAGIDRVLANCRQDHGLGYRQLKIKIGRGNKWMSAEAGLRRDIEVVRAIARDFPDCQLLVDGNDGFSVESVIAFLRGIDGIPLVWIEEPFVESLDSWRRVHTWVRASSTYARTLLADGEQGNIPAVLEQLEREGVLNVRLNDIVGLGFTAWRQLMPALARQNVQGSPHAWGEKLKTIYTGHLVAAFGNCPTIEGVTCSDRDVDFGPHAIVGGKLAISDRPGFGMTLRS